MINELKIKRETLLKKFDKNKITKSIKNTFDKNEIMFIYFSGSITYNTFDVDTSDTDINVFLADYEGYSHINLGEYDVFIYGKSLLNLRQSKENDLSLYNKIFIDDKCALPDTLIYLNPKYESEYKEFINFDISKVLKEYLANVYQYFMFLYVDSTLLGKRFYHVIRIKGQIENYKKAGIYDLTIDDKYKKEMLEFKSNYSNDKARVFYLELIGKYLEEIKEFMEGIE